MKLLIQYWRSCWKRRLVCVVAGLILLCFIYWMWVNWNGARQWRAAQAMLEAEGETLNLNALIPDPVPDEQNYCAIPILKELSKTSKSYALDALALPVTNAKDPKDRQPGFGYSPNGYRVPIKDWVRWLRAEGSIPFPSESKDAAWDLLAALSKHDPLLEQLAAGLDRAPCMLD